MNTSEIITAVILIAAIVLFVFIMALCKIASITDERNEKQFEEYLKKEGLKDESTSILEPFENTSKNN